ncbi:MAG: NifB/NifX family molybdenum-iron cluster-binding protein [Candidatus Aenigmarchaeota archaeon]|nr:NifB/NifX family molybdenum-iron cluster-binding protein [Candidatus Aenigmarchaeota archaeon]
MIVCLTTEQNNLDSLLSSSFKESKYFLFVNLDNNRIRVIKNKKTTTDNLEAVYLVTNQSPQIIITGNIQANSFDFLVNSGIEICCGVFGITAREAIKRYQTKKIKAKITNKQDKQVSSGRGRVL